MKMEKKVIQYRVPKIEEFKKGFKFEMLESTHRMILFDMANPTAKEVQIGKTEELWLEHTVNGNVENQFSHFCDFKTYLENGNIRVKDEDN